MANKFTKLQYYQDIADSIRAINGLTRTYTPPQMTQAIQNLQIGSGNFPELIRLEIESMPDKTNYMVGESFDTTGLSIRAYYFGEYYKHVDLEDLNFNIDDNYIFSRSDVGTTIVTVSYTDEWGATASTNLELYIINTINLKMEHSVGSATGSSAYYNRVDLKIYTEYLKSIKLTINMGAITTYGSARTATWYLYTGTNSITNTNSGTLIDSKSVSAYPANTLVKDTMVYENDNLENFENDWIGIYIYTSYSYTKIDTDIDIVCSLRDGKTMKFRTIPYITSPATVKIHLDPYRLDNLELTSNNTNSYNAYLYMTKSDGTTGSFTKSFSSSSLTQTIDIDSLDWETYDRSKPIYISHPTGSSTNLDFLFNYKIPENLSLSSIAITSTPKKVNYYIGDFLDLSGLVVSATYSDGVIEEIKNYTTSISNSTVLNTSGTKTITVSYTESNVTKTATFTINVLQSQYVNGVQIVSWANGTDAQISAMVEAANQGKINLTNYWSVGDERKITLPAMDSIQYTAYIGTTTMESHEAQDATLVLVDSNNTNYTYVDVPSSGRTYPFFIVQLKNGLKELGVMVGGSNNATGSWGGCHRRKWCNDLFRNSIPDGIRNIFHKVVTKTAETYNGTTIMKCNDYFFLPTEREILTANSYSNATEYNSMSQWSYYSTASNRIKYVGEDGAAGNWWLRSPYKSGTGYYCAINTAGNGTYVYTTQNSLIAPAGCI